MKYSPGFTGPDGKTYRNLVPQVYYLTEKVEDIEETIANLPSGGGGSEIYTTNVYVTPALFTLVDPESVIQTYTYTISFSQFTRPSFFINTGGTNIFDTSIGIYPSITGNKLTFTAYGSAPTVSFYLCIWAYETSESSNATLNSFVDYSSLPSLIPPQARYLNKITLNTDAWSGSNNNYSAFIYTSQFSNYYQNGLTLVIPVAESKQICWNLGIYIAENQIMPSTAITLKSTQIPPEKLDFYIYSIPVSGQTSATVALL